MLARNQLCRPAPKGPASPIDKVSRVAYTGVGQALTTSFDTRRNVMQYHERIEYINGLDVGMKAEHGSETYIIAPCRLGPLRGCLNPARPVTKTYYTKECNRRIQEEARSIPRKIDIVKCEWRRDGHTQEWVCVYFDDTPRHPAAPRGAPFDLVRLSVGCPGRSDRACRLTRENCELLGISS